MPPNLRRVEAANALDPAEYRKRFVEPLSDALPEDADADLEVCFASASELERQEAAVGRAASDLEACFGLVAGSSMADYKASSRRWSAAEKRREMRLPDMRYLLVRGRNHDQDAGGEGEGRDRRDADGAETGGDGSKVLGFVSFMITYEDEQEVVYIYEIHLAPRLQGKGVGRALMGLVEKVAQRAGMSKIMLTVFVSNAGARNFYQRLSYGIDEYSPQPRKLRNGLLKEPDYQILSRPVEHGSSAKRRRTQD